MGEIADDMIDGVCCALCGEYFEEAQGYPCACSECWDTDCGYGRSNSDVI